MPETPLRMNIRSASGLSRREFTGLGIKSFCYAKYSNKSNTDAGKVLFSLELSSAHHALARIAVQLRWRILSEQ
jgi:hypothetical protein